MAVKGVYWDMERMDRPSELRKRTPSILKWLNIPVWACVVGLSIGIAYNNMGKAAIPPVSVEEPTYEIKAPKVEAKPQTDLKAVFPSGAGPELSPLEDFLNRYGDFEKKEFGAEVQAFGRVLQYKDSISDLVRDYEHLDTNLMLAIMKQETQGKQGLNRSGAGAVGPFQMTYFGAYTFLWDAMFSEKICDDEKCVKDFHNSNMRDRYGPQLERIKKELRKEGVLVEPDQYRAKPRTWERLKEHVAKPFDPDEYHVASDIACMYVDYLGWAIDKGLIYDGPDKEDMMIAAYNAGPTAIKRSNGIPNDAECMNYVPKVKHYKGLLDKMNPGLLASL